MPNTSIHLLTPFLTGPGEEILTANLELQGTSRRSIITAHVGTFGFSGTIKNISIKRLFSILMLTSSSSRNILYNLRAKFEFTSNISRHIVQSFMATLNFIGRLPRNLNYVVKGILSFRGQMIHSIIVQSFMATLNFIGKGNFERSKIIRLFADTLLLKPEKSPILILRRIENGEIYGIVNRLERFPEMEMQSVILQRKNF